MEFTLKEKLMLATKYRKYSKNSDHSYKFNGESLVILPDNDIAFKMAQLFTIKAQGKVNYLLKDSIASFYSDEIIENSILYTYNDMNSLGLPRDIFIDKIKTYNLSGVDLINNKSVYNFKKGMGSKLIEIPNEKLYSNYLLFNIFFNLAIKFKNQFL